MSPPGTSAGREAPGASTPPRVPSPTLPVEHALEDDEPTIVLETCNAKHPCRGDPDEPCFCGAPISTPRVIRPSTEYVEQVRALSGDRRWPLRGVSGDVA